MGGVGLAIAQSIAQSVDFGGVASTLDHGPERKQKLVESAKALLATVRKASVAIVHCLMDTNRNLPATKKVTEYWASMHKPAPLAILELAAEFSGLAGAGAAADGGHESTFLRAPGCRLALVTEGIVPLLRVDLGVNHLILGGIATSGALLGTGTHATAWTSSPLS
ncbi:hypothetical protein DL770_007055 [Monosporascus sp. CRB-9-2]|nr:hypothetical protein DL770_007055 [Monosporascus sp. CRB-9-2]